MTHLNHNDAERIAHKIRLMIQERGISPRQMSFMTGLSEHFLSRLERDPRLLTEDVLWRCKEALSLTDKRARPHSAIQPETMDMKDLVAFFDTLPGQPEPPKQPKFDL